MLLRFWVAYFYFVFSTSSLHLLSISLRISFSFWVLEFFFLSLTDNVFLDHSSLGFTKFLDYPSDFSCRESKIWAHGLTNLGFRVSWSAWWVIGGIPAAMQFTWYPPTTLRRRIGFRIRMIPSRRARRHAGLRLPPPPRSGNRSSRRSSAANSAPELVRTSPTYAILLTAWRSSVVRRLTGRRRRLRHARSLRSRRTVEDLTREDIARSFTVEKDVLTEKAVRFYTTRLQETEKALRLV